MRDLCKRSSDELLLFSCAVSGCVTNSTTAKVCGCCLLQLICITQLCHRILDRPHHHSSSPPCHCWKILQVLNGQSAQQVHTKLLAQALANLAGHAGALKSFLALLVPFLCSMFWPWSCQHLLEYPSQGNRKGMGI